ncbi:MAG: flippase-like domain-containing protein [Acidobacteria bacterium]|nr:flippase-like domain-containing protein [Acidobacteriota bacterium]
MSIDTNSRGDRKSPVAVFVSRLVRVLIAGGLLWYAARGVNGADLAQALSDASWGWLGLAVFLVVVDRTVMAWRWLVLLRAIEGVQAPGLLPVLRVFFVSTFVGTFLPGSVGGDALRAMGLSRLGVSTANAVASVAADRLLGTVSVFLMAAVGVGLVGQLVDSALLPLTGLTALVAGAVTYGLLFDARVFRWMLSRLGVRRWPTIDRLAHKFLAAVGQYASHKRVLGQVLTMSIAVQVLRTLQTWCLGLALGLTISGFWYFATVPVIVLVVLLPLSFGGLGTANVAFVTLFAAAGVERDAAFVLSVVFLALGTVGNLPGGLLLATGRASQFDVKT